MYTNVITDLFTLTKKVKQPKFPSTAQWINKISILIQWNMI